MWRHLSAVPYRLICTIVRRRVVVSAEHAHDVLLQTAPLRLRGFRVSIDLMVEDIPDIATVRRVGQFYRELLDVMSEEDLSHIVVKPTSLGLGLSECSASTRGEIFGEHLRLLATSIAAECRKRGGRDRMIEIDAESTKTMDLAYGALAVLRNCHPKLGSYFRTAIPMHMKTLPEMCDKYELLDYPVRIVKGAGVYNEDPALLVDRETVIKRYEEYFLECLARNTHPFIATVHDEKLLRRVLQSAKDRGYEKKEFSIQMLYGLWSGLGRRLLAEGYTVCIYVPVVLPWCKSASEGYVERRVSMFRELAWKWCTLQK